MTEHRAAAHPVAGRAAYPLVALGGAVGAVARYGLTSAFPDPVGGFPWTTFAINVLGSFALGLLVAGIARRQAAAWLRPALGTGVLGGFTTFSAVAVAFHLLTVQDHVPTGVAYLAASVLAALGAAALGAALGARLPAVVDPRSPGDDGAAA